MRQNRLATAFFHDIHKRTESPVLLFNPFSLWLGMEVGCGRVPAHSSGGRWPPVSRPLPPPPAPLSPRIRGRTSTQLYPSTLCKYLNPFILSSFLFPFRFFDSVLDRHLQCP